MHDKPGKNIPMVLGMEYLNRNFKDFISQLRSNAMDSTLQRTGKALKSLRVKSSRELQMLYDSVTTILQKSMHHKFQSNSKDRNEVIEALKKATNRCYD